jgi:hypothetical protein
MNCYAALEEQAKPGRHMTLSQSGARGKLDLPKAVGGEEQTLPKPRAPPNTGREPGWGEHDPEPDAIRGEWSRGARPAPPGERRKRKTGRSRLLLCRDTSRSSGDVAATAKLRRAIARPRITPELSRAA